MEPKGYQNIWKREESLESLNKRLHDGVPIEKLYERAIGYRDAMFERFFPYAKPSDNDRVMELGSGVGWIMQAMIEKYPNLSEIIGLDISENMIKRAQERWQHTKAKYVLYDGNKIPFADKEISIIYSVAAIQHIDKNIAFLIFKEIYRVLSIGGHAVLHFLSVHHIPKNQISYEEECRNHINNNTDTHWHHFYSFDELYVLFSEVLGVSDFDARYDNNSIFIHFSKGTGRKFKNESLKSLIDPEKLKVGYENIS